MFHYLGLITVGSAKVIIGGFPTRPDMHVTAYDSSDNTLGTHNTCTGTATLEMDVYLDAACTGFTACNGYVQIADQDTSRLIERYPVRGYVSLSGSDVYGWEETRVKSSARSGVVI